MELKSYIPNLFQLVQSSYPQLNFEISPYLFFFTKVEIETHEFPK